MPAVTLEKFLSVVQDKHKDQYDLSRVHEDYSSKGLQSVVWVGCKDHGWSKVRAYNVFKNVGCLGCAEISRQKTKKQTCANEFEAKAIKVHGEDLFDYSEVEYVDCDTPVKIGCVDCGESFMRAPKRHLSRLHGCPICVHKIRGKRVIAENRKKFLNRAEAMHGKDRYTYLSEYEHCDKHMTISCNVCSNIFTQAPSNHLRGRGCPACAAARNPMIQAAKDRNAHLRIHFKDEMFLIHPTLTFHGDYEHASQYMDITCSVCNRTFNKNINDVRNGQGCPHCVKPKGEVAIAEWYDERNIEYIAQWWHPDCVGDSGRKPLQFDFYLPKYNVVIEFNGEQHYRPVNFGGMSEEEVQLNFERTQRYDKIKRLFCDTKKIPVLDIEYKDLKRIPEILEGFMKDLKIESNTLSSFF